MIPPFTSDLLLPRPKMPGPAAKAEYHSVDFLPSELAKRSIDFFERRAGERMLLQ